MVAWAAIRATARAGGAWALPLFETLFKNSMLLEIMVIVGFNNLPWQLSRTYDGL